MTNDGATILKAIGVDNPAAKVLVGKRCCICVNLVCFMLMASVKCSQFLLLASAVTFYAVCVLLSDLCLGGITKSISDVDGYYLQ